MSAERIMSQAQARAGLDDFGDPRFFEGLKILACAVDTSAALAPAGRAAFSELFVSCLVNRLKVVDWAKRHPAISKNPVRQPLFILGAPRTGTTLVTNLFAIGRTRRPLMRWEALDSVPPAKRGALHTDPRCLAMQKADASAPTTSSSIHHEEPDGPTECVLILAQDFKSMMFDAMLDSPEYAEWILHTDMTSAYAYHHLALQVMQAETGGPWVLKMPSHAVFIRTLLQIYPDAKIIRTHRDPYAALTSLCSLVANIRGQFGDVEPSLIGPAYIQHFMAHLQRPEEVLATSAPDKVCNVHYADLMRDPIAEMKRIYAWLGSDFTPELEQATAGWLAANPQGRFGRHSYKLQQYGLTESILKPYFDDYIANHSVALERDSRSAA